VLFISLRADGWGVNNLGILRTHQQGILLTSMHQQLFYLLTPT
jgi:hypothetical protein